MGCVVRGFAETERFLADLVAEVGQPTDDEHARADGLAERIAGGRRRRAG